MQEKKMNEEDDYKRDMKIINGVFTKTWVKRHLDNINQDWEKQAEVNHITNNLMKYLNKCKVNNTVRLEVFMQGVIRCIIECTQCENEKCRNVIKKELGV